MSAPKCGKTEMLGLDRGARASQQMHSGRIKWCVTGSDGEIIASDENAARAWQRAFARTYRKRQSEEPRP